ncbi:MAG: hypothetical protein KKE02_08580 [Alphaproteobacteria bacterium]|nr:hypothetical protein [Alphaproteobacteria bacterium]MBU1513552.1 hypothetical protein [Alphaproteobacteria bacterium]MBU2094803.1 hypothetical protein [Alphaproteobacteria bacterium]MBU2151060.1 hypothetical protein [Alphaproteobacteria bacterium]MBU2309343.1 hypothetical protein [Alphaproteobacteria bacterium]
MAGRMRDITVAVAALALLGTTSAHASGPGSEAPWYLDQFGGDAADLKRLYDGNLGIVMARAPRPQLYIAWRLLHGQAVGQAAGDALSTPCCDPPWRWTYAPRDNVGVDGWLKTRKTIPGVAEIGFLSTDRDGANYATVVNCFDEAFDTASATLKDRAAKYGAGSPEVRAWVDAQDGVFQACHDAEAKLPAPLANAPGWLKADRAYQEAAFALYQGDNTDAAIRFADIAKDKGSPWRPLAPYLRTRALVRSALYEKTGDTFNGARAAVADLAKAPAGAFGQGEARKMRRLLDFRERPKALMADLDKELAHKAASPDIAVSFRDYSSLYDKGIASPDAMDWIATVRARPDRTAMDAAEEAESSADAVVKLQKKTESDALAHARSRWTASRDPAWLIAALSLADPDTPGAADLAAAAGKVGRDSPAWLSTQYHLTRLTLGVADAGATRARLDAILQRTDLSVSDRNVLTAQRAQVAADAGDFVRFSLRKRLCADSDEKSGCVRGFWQADAVQPGGVYDKAGWEGTQGFGEDARAVIDRLPLKDRIALSRDARLPAPLRLDVALTSYARAVALGDHASVDSLAADLEKLLPQMAEDWKRVRTTTVGPDKRFYEFFVLAKVPGIRIDLVEYTRPEGTVAQFQSSWTDWIIPAKGKPVAPDPPALAQYQSGGVIEYDAKDDATDLTCLGECGVGVAPLRLPDFVRAAQGQAKAERGYFVRIKANYSDDAPPPPPAGSVAVWDEMLAYAAANPKNAQVPEALYWLVRVGRFGGSHNHSGRRAFQLLHKTYPTSPWTKRSPYFYD